MRTVAAAAALCVVAGALCVVAGALVVMAEENTPRATRADDAPAGLAPALDPAALLRTAAERWADTSRIDFTRTDDADVTTGAAVVVSRGGGGPGSRWRPGWPGPRPAICWRRTLRPVHWRWDATGWRHRSRAPP